MARFMNSRDQRSKVRGQSEKETSNHGRQRRPAESCVDDKNEARKSKDARMAE